jgi:hypothetical protein
MSKKYFTDFNCIFIFIYKRLNIQINRWVVIILILSHKTSNNTEVYSTNVSIFFNFSNESTTR